MNRSQPEQKKPREIPEYIKLVEQDMRERGLLPPEPPPGLPELTYEDMPEPA